MNDDRRHDPERLRLDLHVAPITINHVQVADAAVLAKLDELLAAVKQSEADRAKLVQATADLKKHTDGLKAATTTAQGTGTP